jgi:hypothetical protein
VSFVSIASVVCDDVTFDAENYPRFFKAPAQKNCAVQAARDKARRRRSWRSSSRFDRSGAVIRNFSKPAKKNPDDLTKQYKACDVYAIGGFYV